VRLALTMSAVLLAWALYRWVERPVRRGAVPVNRVTLAATLATSTAVVLIGCGLYYGKRSANQVDWTFARRGNLGLSAACEYSDAFTNVPRCQTSETPGIMDWGDSYAMHLVEGIRTTSETGLVQATRTTCGPLVGVSSFQAGGWYNRAWGEKCVRFNDDVLAYLAAKPSVEVVVMSIFLRAVPGGQSIAGARNEWLDKARACQLRLAN
jgi:hypothetical protein